MSRARLVAVLVGIILVLGLLVWLVGSVSQLYYSIALTSPMLANLLLFLLVGLFAVLAIVLFYYALQFTKPTQKKPLPTVPVEKVDAARENLRAVQQQIDQIEDEVTRQALASRSREIGESLSRREICVVVFGTGSAGKTSLINAIYEQITGQPGAGQVGAPMGTTIAESVVRLQLRGLGREILLTDTPGILEAGIAGTEREQAARRLATEADLLLFVVDNDLRQSEYTVLRSLLNIGKRSIVVFNKTDLYPQEDLDALLTQLQQRLQDVISAQDIVPIAANPQPVQLDNGEWLTPDPDIFPLLQRVAAVLRSEGENLVADNILLQSQQLSEAARQQIDDQRRQQAEKIVDRYQWIVAGAVTVTPLPGVDLLATAAINAQMVLELGRVYGCDINLERGKDLAISLAKTLVSLGVVRGAIELLSITLQTNVGTFLVGRAIQGVTGAYLTRIAGKSFIEYFRRNQDWGDGGMTEVVQEQFRLNQRDEFMREFMQEAIDRVVKPLVRE
ncbi:YcjF family protein [Leptolyngbya ohadii]|uniref:YcjF family protein n=1 Tax=Leptolyngbya ohadii TaxID=1962290 RepID=UPI000B5A17A1|nr:GTP-binding protein [Leptolyngbya ohadii]